MRYLISIILLGIVFSSCKKNNTIEFLSGSYKGTFQRQLGVTGAISNVTLTFSSSSFTGQSQSPKYPALCNGIYSLSSDKITFHDGCIWTADFDGTLILDGEYNFQKSGDSIFIFKYYPGIIYTADYYKLKNQ